MSEKNRYIIGIDLGTTNSAVGYVDLHETGPGSIAIHSFEILQLTGPGLTSSRTSLPSFLYLPGEFDLQQGTLALPWDSQRDYAVGEFARNQGSMVPGRLVSSAKSWLCHGGVDRDAPILPWGAGEEVEKVSPITASSRYIQHMKEAWNHTMPARMEDQTVVLTVPASFDQVARELTLEAARQAGLTDVVLLEEPLAAFYAWLSNNEESWQDDIKPDDLLLVCDIGGGTSDFTLISCVSHDDGPRLERVAVGEHLLLGGDNMDLAIAALAEKKLGEKDMGVTRWQSLYHQCREAKERLFGDEAAESVTIRLAGRGHSLVGGTVTTEISRSEVEEILLQGFYPEVDSSDTDTSAERGTGLKEMGLPFCSDPAVTRHLLRFIHSHASGRMPSLVLYNGGSLKPAVLRQRFTSLISRWAGKEIQELKSHSLDLAISWGAVYYGLVRHGLGLRVGGGIPRAYFAGISSQKKDRVPKAVCLLERGTEEGQRVELERSFRVHTNRPVKFSLYSSTVRQGDRAGDVVAVDEESMVKLPALQTVLKYGKKGQDTQIPVHLEAEVTAIGTLELYCRSTETPHRWRLQFQLREEQRKPELAPAVEGVTVAAQVSQKEPGADQASMSHEDRKAVQEASAIIRACFEPDSSENPVSPKGLVSRISEILGMEKNLWSLPVLRALADTLLEVKKGRKRTAEHEARWFNLAGFCLRPGTGEVTDVWRMKQVWPLYFEGLANGKQIENRLQWWIFWRRVSAGLGAGHQKQIFSSMMRAILPDDQKKKRRKKGKLQKAIKVPHEERRQMWFFASGLERLDVRDKIRLGRTLLAEACRANAWNGALWALSRIGARQPLYGPANKTVPPAEVWSWINTLKKKELAGKHLIECVVSLARLTGDRSRDLASSALEEIDVWLEVIGATPEQRRPLREVVEIKGADRSSAFGESLPEGLLIGEEE